MKKVHTGYNLHILEGKSSLPQKSFPQRIKMLLASAPFLVGALLGTQGCSNEQKKIEKGNTSGSNPKVEQVLVGGASQNVISTAEQGGEEKEGGEKIAPIESGKHLISLMMLPGTEKRNEIIDANRLGELYQDYRKTLPELGVQFEKYIKKLLLDAHIDMVVKNGLEVNGYKGLEDFKERITFLSEGTIKITLGKTMPQQSEFTEKIRIIGTMIKETGTGNGDAKKTLMAISKENVPIWRSDNTSTVHFPIDSGEMMRVFVSDFPVSYTQAFKEISKLHADFLGIQENLGDAKEKIGKLEYIVAELEKVNTKIKAEKAQDLINAAEATKKAKKAADEDKKASLAQQRELYNGNIALLEASIERLRADLKAYGLLMAEQRKLDGQEKGEAAKLIDKAAQKALDSSNQYTSLQMMIKSKDETIARQQGENESLKGEIAELKRQKDAEAKRHREELEEARIGLILGKK